MIINCDISKNERFMSYTSVSKTRGKVSNIETGALGKKRARNCLFICTDIFYFRQLTELFQRVIIFNFAANFHIYISSSAAGK